MKGYSHKRLRTLVSKVALVELDKDVHKAFGRALKLIGNVNDLNKAKRPVVVKPGIFAHKAKNHPTVDVVNAIVRSFDSAPRVFLAESDNYRGTGLERLQIYKKVFTERVVPFNLSEDVNTREVEIAGEEMRFSHILFKPNVLVSTHALRRYKEGTILKNLLGLIPDRKKARFHKKLHSVLLDAYEAVGGIDLAVIDATYTYPGPSSREGAKTNALLVGRDAVAVEAVGATLVGLSPEKMPVIQEAVRRGLGEGDVERIEVLGSSLESMREDFHLALKRSKKKEMEKKRKKRKGKKKRKKK